MKDKIFSFSVTKEGDSVIQTGRLENLQSLYFSHYTKALEFLRERCEEFVDENCVDPS